MNKEELAQMLNGREYGHEITHDEERMAAANGLVIVTGYSDDSMEFYGAFRDETGMEALVIYDGAKASLLTNRCDCYECPYFLNEQAKWGANKITAVWDSEGYSWIYRTDIPHATFNIMEGEDYYCRSIVFAVEDLEGE